jgi:IS30 family transposase
MNQPQPTRHRHLTREQRYQISALHANGNSRRAIAAQLQVAHTTIGRELRRVGGDVYRPEAAHADAVVKRSESKLQYRKITGELQKHVDELLNDHHSPEQTAGVLQFKHPQYSIGHSAIYRYIAREKADGGRLFKKLRHKGKRYNYGKGEAGRGVIPGRRDISERPAVVETKLRIGDWEIDTIIGAQHKGAIVSAVDRKSKKVLLRKVESKEAEVVTRALIEMLMPYRTQVLTITADNGKEFAGHKEVAAALGADFYFAKPYRSWERGLNEHTNGLVREFFPKKTMFADIGDEDVAAVERNLNRRARKVLKYATPDEVFFAPQTTP